MSRGFNFNLYVNTQLSQRRFYERLFFYSECSLSLFKNQWAVGVRFLLDTLFCWSIYLFKIPVPFLFLLFFILLFTFFYYCDFVYALKFGTGKLPALFFLIKIVLAVFFLLQFLITCRTFSNSVKNVLGIWMEMALNL